MIDQDSITETYRRILPFMRRTPIIEIDGADLGIAGDSLFFKLEYLQHAGSFKARGAFANLLMRKVPPAGVVAASGGNHGVAVAYAAMRLGKAGAYFRAEHRASPAKMARIRECNAELVVAGERYAGCARGERGLGAHVRRAAGACL